MTIVADAGPIISFARAGRLDLLRQIVSELIIPETVFEEIVVRGRGKPGADQVQHGLWIKRTKVQDRSVLEQMPGKLNSGEREAIAVAKEIGSYLLVDEIEARKEADRRGVLCIGSLRILKEAKDRGIITKAKPVLDELIASGTYLSDDLYRGFLREVREEEETLPE